MITGDKPVPLEISVANGDETAIGFINKGVSLGNVNFNTNRFQIFSNHLPGIINKQIFVISDNERTIWDYKTKGLRKILVDSDMKFRSGDVLKIKKETPFIGYLSNSSRTINFTIPLTKSIENVDLELKCLDMEVRSSGVYFTNGGVYGGDDISQYSLRFIKSNNLLGVAVDKSIDSKWSDTFNNVVVEVDGNFTLTIL